MSPPYVAITAAALLFGLSTYFGVFVLETLVRQSETHREAQAGSASHVRTRGRWLAPAVWVLTVFAMALFVGYFIATPPPQKAPLVRFDIHELPRPGM